MLYQKIYIFDNIKDKLGMICYGCIFPPVSFAVIKMFWRIWLNATQRRQSVQHKPLDLKVNMSEDAAKFLVLGKVNKMQGVLCQLGKCKHLILNIFLFNNIQVCLTLNILFTISQLSGLMTHITSFRKCNL